jgi:arsenite methyltransferase
VPNAGAGLLVLGLAERVGPDGDVLAIDRSVDALEELRARAVTANISYLVGSADVLPLPDRSLDAVVTGSPLDVEDVSAVAQELFRVLRSGGRLLLSEPGERRPAWNESLYAAGFADVETDTLLTGRKP